MQSKKRAKDYFWLIFLMFYTLEIQDWLKGHLNIAFYSQSQSTWGFKEQIHCSDKPMTSIRFSSPESNGATQEPYPPYFAMHK